MRFTDLMMAFPALLLAIALAAIFQPVLWIVALVIAMVNWVQIARVIYTETTGRCAERDLIEAARSLGAGTGAHPLAPLPAASGADDAGLGDARHRHHRAARGDAVASSASACSRRTPSWGNIIFENQTYFATAPWLVFFPGAAILLLALAFNLVGDALRDVLDPTQQGRG